MKKKSILVVEDSTLTRFSIKRYLENKGYEVVEATSGEEALAKIAQRLSPFDLVIVDIHLPGMDGLATAKKIRENPQYRYVPLMCLTADAKASTVREAIHIGAVDYLRKPFSIEQLLQRVERIVGRAATEEPAELLERLLRLETNRAQRGNLKFSLVLAQRKAPGKSNAADVKRYIEGKLREIDEVIALEENLLALVLPLTERSGAEVVIQKVQEWVGGKDWHFGLAVYPEDGKSGAELLAFAKKALAEGL